MSHTSEASLFCVLLCTLGFCLNVNSEKMRKIEFVEGYVGGACKETAGCLGRVEVEKVCLAGICNCGNGFKAFEVAITQLIGCFGLEGSPCTEGLNHALYEYLTNRALWDVHFEIATKNAKENLFNEDLQHHVEALKKIADSGMNGKSNKDWNCQSGSCTTENKCAKGPPHGALNRVQLPEGTTPKTKSGGDHVKKKWHILVTWILSMLTVVFGYKLIYFT